MYWNIQTFFFFVKAQFTTITAYLQAAILMFFLQMLIGHVRWMSTVRQLQSSGLTKNFQRVSPPVLSWRQGHQTFGGLSWSTAALFFLCAESSLSCWKVNSEAILMQLFFEDLAFLWLPGFLDNVATAISSGHSSIFVSLDHTIFVSNALRFRDIK